MRKSRLTHHCRHHPLHGSLASSSPQGRHHRVYVRRRAAAQFTQTAPATYLLKRPELAMHWPNHRRASPDPAAPSAESAAVTPSSPTASRSLFRSRFQPTSRASAASSANPSSTPQICKGLSEFQSTDSNPRARTNRPTQWSRFSSRKRPMAPPCFQEPARSSRISPPAVSFLLRLAGTPWKGSQPKRAPANSADPSGSWTTRLLSRARLPLPTGPCH